LTSLPGLNPDAGIFGAKLQMHIKRVLIRGFKVFGELTQIGDFSPGTNCLFGLNGTGKSTLLQAIEFVLLDEFTQIRPNDRQALLFSGKGNPITTAFVEIVFDNADQRLPLSHPEISIRRSIGLNKDEYFIDRKHITRAELKNLFETAGLSLAASLFVVQQGRVKAVAEMTDEARLQLLYEISGIQSYNDKREQSLRMMDEANLRRQKIDQALPDIQKRLTELEAETAELTEYESLDNVRKALEFLVHDHERARVVDEIAQNEEEINRESSVVENMRKVISEQKSVIRELEDELKGKRREKDRLGQVLAESANKRDQLIQDQARFDYKIGDLQQKLDDAEVLTAEIQAKLEKLKSRKDEKELTIAQLVQTCDRLRSERARMEAALEHPNALTDCQQEIQRLTSTFESLDREMEAAAQTLERLREREFQNSLQCQNLTEMFGNLAVQIGDLKHQQISKIDTQKKLWQREHSLKTKEKSLVDSLANAERRMSHFMTSPVTSALAFLRSHNFQLTFGLLLDLIEFDPALDLAVDAVAKSQLFYLVVETDSIADDILTALRNDSSGRLSIFALNRVRSSRRDIPRTSTVSPLIDELQFADRIRPVCESVFGSAALCSTLDVAIQNSRQLGAVCVTLTGEIVSPTGSMIGGADETAAIRHSPNHTRRLIGRLHEEQREVSAHLESIAGELSDVKDELEAIGREITRRTSDQFSYDAQIQTNESEAKQIRHEIHVTEKVIEVIQKRMHQTQNSLTILQQKEKALIERIQGVSVTFSQEEYLRNSSEFSHRMLALESHRSELEDCLIPEIRKLESRFASFDSRRLVQKLDKAQLKQAHQSRRISHFDKDLQAADQQLLTLNDEIDATERALGKARDALHSKEREMTTQQKCVSDYHKQLVLQTAKQDEVLKKIASIGLFPTAEVEVRKQRSYQELMREMHMINNDLERFRFVNKRAFDQFRQFRDQRKELELRREEIARDEDAIHELIRQLDQKKRDSIYQCFDMVSEKFQKIYSFFEPAKRAIVVLKQHGDFITELDPEKVTGIGILVGDEQVEGLSGGERTIVGLSLLFAVQQIEPSPFYILDEVDSDLDVAHLRKLGEFLQTMATGDQETGSQFIYATHKDELIAAADKLFAVYAVSPSMSTVREVSLDEASRYLET
jgi:structural maintenance of chromosome 3 (chondroitin sulfate proteoglycan 6)